MTDEITQNDCQGEGESDDRETFSDPTDIIPMTDQYDWRCFVDTRYGPYFLCKDGYPLKDSSEWNAGWRVCAAEVGRERSIMKFAADVARLNAELTEAREIIGELMVGADIFYAELMPEMISLFEALKDAFPDNKIVSDHLGRLRKASVIEDNSTVSRARAFLTKGTQ